MKAGYKNIFEKRLCKAGCWKFLCSRQRREFCDLCVAEVEPCDPSQVSDFRWERGEGVGFFGVEIKEIATIESVRSSVYE